MEGKKRSKQSEEETETPDGVSKSSHSHSDPHFLFGDQNDPVGSVLSNPDILESVFPYLDVSTLKSVRQVCSIWSRAARPFLYSKSTINLRDADPDELTWSGCNPPEVSLEDRLVELEAAKIPCKINYKIHNGESKLVPILAKIQGNVERLTLYMTPHEDGDRFEGGPYANVQFHNLKSITVESTCELDRSDSGKETSCVLLLLEIIRRSPNLQELCFSNDKYELKRIFFDTLLGPQGLPTNERFKETVKSIWMKNSLCLYPEDIEAFIQMKLKIKTLSVPIIIGSDAVFQVPALCAWLEDLSSTLEDLYIYCLYDGSHVNNWKLEFSTEMKKLKTLHITESALFGVDDIIPLVQRMPNLKNLFMGGTIFTGVKLSDFNARAFEGTTYSNLKQLNIAYCGVWTYVPKLFPTLTRLSLNVYSKKSFLACIYDLKDMMIEEMELNFRYSTKGSETVLKTCVPLEWSFNSWKKLRKLSFYYPTCWECPYAICQCEKTHDSSLTEVYNIPIEHILSGRLTSLRLRNLGQVEASCLINLLKRMPLLMHLDFMEGCVVNEEGNRMDRSAFMDKIGKDPSINPYLHIPNRKGLFSTTAKVNSDSD